MNTPRKKQSSSGSQDGPKASASHKRFSQKSRRRLVAIAIVVGLYLAFKFFFATYLIPTGAMYPTLLVGDHILVQRLVYFRWTPPEERRVRDVNRGDILVFRSLEEPGRKIIKRVVGLPGERIRIEDKTVYINDEPLDETYAVFSDLRGEAATEGRDSVWEIIVPENSYFMLGDNRDNSYDSRVYGPVPGDLVTGRPLFIYWSFDASTADYLAETTWEKIKFALSTALNFFSRTRWDRTFRPIG